MSDAGPWFIAQINDDLIVVHTYAHFFPFVQNSLTSDNEVYKLNYLMGPFSNKEDAVKISEIWPTDPEMLFNEIKDDLNVELWTNHFIVNTNQVVVPLTIKKIKNLKKVRI